MKSTDVNQLAAIRQYLKQTSRYDGKSVEQIRQVMEEAAARFPELTGTSIEQASIGELAGEWVKPANVPLNEAQAIVYFHGGGFISGSCAFYRHLAAAIARASGVKLLTVEYRLAPEHVYPAANEDCLHAYRWLLTQGCSPRNVVLGGDSVGGSLALMTLLSLRDAGEEMPAGAFLMSPHTDLVHLDGESYRTRAELDPTGSLQTSERILQSYLGDAPSTILAILSPLRMDLHGLPPMLIQAGDHEVLLSDATRFADRAAEAGVEVELQVWEQMWSVFQLLAHMLPEAQQAIADIGRFVRQRID